MAKKRNQPSIQAPQPRTIETRSKTQRKKSIDQSIESQNKSIFEQVQVSQKESQVSQNNLKNINAHEDIDIYFAACFDSHHQNKEEQISALEKNINQEKYFKQEVKKTQNIIIKQEHMDIQPSQIQSSLANIVQTNEVNQSDQNDFENDSPMFGHKIRKGFITPQHKLEELRAYDQSEEIVHKPLIDQFEEGQKIQMISPSLQNKLSMVDPNTFQIGNSIFRTEKKRIVKERKRYSSKRKIKIQEKILKSNEGNNDQNEVRQFSFKRSQVIDEAKKRALNLRLTTLSTTNMKYEQTQRTILSLENSLRSVMNYYNLKQLNTKLLAFRFNIFKVLRDEIQRLMCNVSSKKEICVEAIQEKFKQGNEALSFCEDKYNYQELLMK